MTIHELYGRLAEALENEAAAHRKTFEVLASVKDGSISLDRLTVTGSGWTVAPPEAQEPLLVRETTINEPTNRIAVLNGEHKAG